MNCQRGELYWVDWNPGRGVEQQGRRPALVVQNDRGNRSSAAIVVVAISSAPLPRVYPFTVPLAAGQGGLPRDGHVNCSQLVTVDQRRVAALIGSLDSATMARVDAALRYELDL